MTCIVGIQHHVLDYIRDLGMMTAGVCIGIEQWWTFAMLIVSTGLVEQYVKSCRSRQEEALQMKARIEGAQKALETTNTLLHAQNVPLHFDVCSDKEAIATIMATPPIFIPPLPPDAKVN